MNKRFKLYLLSILYGFYNDGNVRMAVTEDEVVGKSEKVCRILILNIISRGIKV